MEPTLSSETSAFILRTPGKFPKEHRLHSEHGESLKTTIRHLYGEETTRSIRLLETLRIKKTKLLVSLIFLLRCRDHNIIPHSLSPRTMELTLSSETSAFIFRTPGKFPKEHRLYFHLYPSSAVKLVTNLFSQPLPMWHHG